MRSRDEILADLYFKKQFQGSSAEKAIVELLLDIRDQNRGKKAAIVTGFKETL